jgi:transcription initiation factor TFIID subunit 1
MSSRDENDAISALTGFSLNHVLDGLQLPAGTNLSNQLGISGIPTLSSTQIYNEKWEEEEDVIGAEQGEDWEAEIDRELREEARRNPLAVKKEAMSPGFQPRKKRTRTIQRYVERPKSVYELFPSYSRNKILDFTEILKGNTSRKSRVIKRHYLGVCLSAMPV